MKFRINLASQPYEDVRRFYFQWGGVLAAIVLVTIALISLAAFRYQKARGLRRQIVHEQQLLKRLNDQEAADLAILNRPENQDVHERSTALNSLIHRKEFSWTRIFADMEKLMPARLHVVSIVPQVTPENDIEIRLQVAGESRDKAIELVQRMEKSPDFRHAQILSETNAESKPGTGTAGDVVQFDISALYIPLQVPPEAVPAPAPAPAGGR